VIDAPATLPGAVLWLAWVLLNLGWGALFLFFFGARRPLHQGR
jgi:hypothetical protein